MTIEAKIVCDSLHPNGSRLTTYVLRYPRWLHSELLTHRSLSRNASSSRAIPVAKFVAWAREEPAMPEVWFKNKAGMQGTELMDPETIAKCEAIILKMRDVCAAGTEELSALGLHKQTANRYLEPWHHITVIVTATEWANFFALRYHEMAEPHIHILARMMLQAYTLSTPRALSPHQWHLPFIRDEERGLDPMDLIKYSVARCARVSYLNHDGSNPDWAKDIALHDALVVQKPLHASPAEHQARVNVEPFGGTGPSLKGNFAPGWIQYRKTLADEVVRALPKLRPEHAL